MAFQNGIYQMLKTFYYKKGIQSLLLRNDPFLKQIVTRRVEGKQFNFSALFSRGGACSANYTKAKSLALTTAQAKEFQVTAGQLFSACVFTNKENLAAKTFQGAYIPVCQAKFFANTESFRKLLAVALYGTGHGELFSYAADSDAEIASGSAGQAVELTFPKHAVMGIDIGSELEVKAAVNSTTVDAVLTVTKINGTTVTAKVRDALGSALALASKVVVIAGCTDDSGKPMLPVGLAGWLPKSAPSVGEDFFGVDRSIARDRLAGVSVTATSGAKKYEAIEEGILALRRQGSLCDVILMNDEDYLAMSREIEAKTYFTKTNGGTAKQKAEIGNKDFGFSVSTNWVENVMDSPFCPKGTCYILSSDTISLATYSNADKIVDGIVGNEPGKPEVTSEDAEANRPYQALVDDLLSYTPGEDTPEGPATVVAINFYGQFVVDNPSVNGVVTFA